MFAVTEDLALKNSKILKELSESTDCKQDPSSEFLSKIKTEKSIFLSQWNEIVSKEHLSSRMLNIFASLLGASVLSNLDPQFEEIEQVAVKLEQESGILSQIKSFNYIVEKMDELFTTAEKELLKLPGKICSTEIDSNSQKIYNKSFKSFGIRMSKIAENIMNHVRREVTDSSYHSEFDFITGGEGREVYQWLIEDYKEKGEPKGHFFYNKDIIAGSFGQGSGVYVKEKETKNLVGYAAYSYNNVSQPPNLELDVIEVLESYQRRGISKLILNYIYTKLHPRVFVITGSPITESIPVFSNWSLCQFQFEGKYSRNQRMFISTKPFATSTKICPNGFALSLDGQKQYHSIQVSAVEEKEDFSLFKIKDSQSLRDIYLMAEPIIIPQVRERNYEKNPIKIDLWYDREKVAEKIFRDSYCCDKYNDENVIYLAGTCVWIGYLYGELGTKVSEILSGLDQIAKRPKLCI